MENLQDKGFNENEVNEVAGTVGKTTTNPGQEMEELKRRFSHIKGWGVDFDPEDQPNYPMKKYTGDDHNRLNYERPPQQKVDVEILRSTERPTISAVFGTAVPPSGLSGIVRRFAYKFSESEYGHWLSLLLADRINVVEGVVQDLSRGHIPNIFAEKGSKADWKHNRKGAVKKIAVTALVTTALVVFILKKKQKRESMMG